VIIPHYDVSKLLSKYDIESDSIVSHPHKELGSWTKEMSPEERKKLQDQVNLLFARFKNIIKQGRPMFKADEDALNQVATGEVFTGEQAKDLMLVDEVGFIEDAIKRAADLADLGKDDYRVVEYQSPASLADVLSGNVQASRHPLDARALLELATPRAYYLYSWLPPLTAQ
jgi:protease-4